MTTFATRLQDRLNNPSPHTTWALQEHLVDVPVSDVETQQLILDELVSRGRTAEQVINDIEADYECKTKTEGRPFTRVFQRIARLRQRFA